MADERVPAVNWLLLRKLLLFGLALSSVMIVALILILRYPDRRLLIGLAVALPGWLLISVLGYCWNHLQWPTEWKTLIRAFPPFVWVLVMLQKITGISGDGSIWREMLLATILVTVMYLLFFTGKLLRAVIDRRQPQE